jgi:hypothetical protein
MQREFHKRGLSAIYVEDHIALKTLYKETRELEYDINISDLFLKLFFSACIQNRKNTIIFLFQCYFDLFTQVEQIALRQSFFYGKYRIKNKQLTQWYSDTILPIIRGH